MAGERAGEDGLTAREQVVVAVRLVAPQLAAHLGVVTAAVDAQRLREVQGAGLPAHRQVGVVAERLEAGHDGREIALVDGRVYTAAA